MLVRPLRLTFSRVRSIQLMVASIPKNEETPLRRGGFRVRRRDFLPAAPALSFTAL
jgi:hypothetical protein